MDFLHILIFWHFPPRLHSPDRLIEWKQHSFLSLRRWVLRGCRCPLTGSWDAPLLTKQKVDNMTFCQILAVSHAHKVGRQSLLACVPAGFPSCSKQNRICPDKASCLPPVKCFICTWYRGWPNDDSQSITLQLSPLVIDCLFRNFHN